MMSPFADWPHRWFGCWREFGRGFTRCPSIDEFVDEGWQHPRRGDLVRYLSRAPSVAVTSRVAIPWARGEGDGRTSVGYRSDGVWLWFDDLDYYVTEQAVRPPDALVAHVEQNRYRPPRRLRVDRAALDWPPGDDPSHRREQRVDGA